MEKQIDYQSLQKELAKRWQESNVYTSFISLKKLFTIDTPPPTVSGKLHIGHIFSYTQTDFIARFKRMNGFSVFYPFGFDDNGLATERFIEKKYATSPYVLGREKFIKLCLEETKLAAQQFTHLWQKLGLSANFNNTYTTISKRVQKLSQESFLRLFKKKYIYKKFEPALYCTACHTSVAQAELDDIEKPSIFNTISFELVDGKEAVKIATTRPELLPSCVAIFYHPDDTRFNHLAGKKARTPLFDQEVPILPDELVQPEKGTGLVMCCTFGDKTDVLWIKKHNLPYILSIDMHGKMIDNKNILTGLKVEQARIKIIELLKEQHKLVAQKPIMHMVNIHERCKKEIEYTILSQWFLEILPYKKKFIELADQINWYPAYMKSRYINWVENINWDWCLSRQRIYGIPFPVWHCNNCQEILLADYSMLPIDPQKTSYPGNMCPQCKSEDIKPDTDVMDTWNTSSITPFIIYDLFYKESINPFEQNDNFLPMSMRPQAHDIIRTWAFYTIVKAYMHSNQIPWKDIVISGHVLADGKEKLSKSKEQKKLDPEFLIAQYNADTIRYWTAISQLGQDTQFSETQLKIGQKLITKLWNAFRFIYEHTQDAHPIKPSTFGLINEWLLHRISDTFAMYQKEFEHYAYNQALKQVEEFFWKDFCDNYLELIKDQLFHPEYYTHSELAATRFTLYHVGLRILQLFAPFLPFITEKIYLDVYQKIEKTTSIHQTEFDNTQINYDFPYANELMHKVILVIAQVRKFKTEQQLSLKHPFTCLTIVENQGLFKNNKEKIEQLIKGITHAQKIEYACNKKSENINEHLTIVID